MPATIPLIAIRCPNDVVFCLKTTTKSALELFPTELFPETTSFHRLMRCVLFLALIALTACDSLPRDPEGTLVRIKHQRTFIVALVEGSPSPPVLGRFIGEVSRRTHAAAIMRSGPSEELLTDLREGDVDLVVGPFEKNSPWADEITFAPPLTEGPDDIELKAAVRNGENRWIMTIERAARAVSRKARAE